MVGRPEATVVERAPPPTWRDSVGLGEAPGGLEAVARLRSAFSMSEIRISSSRSEISLLTSTWLHEEFSDLLLLSGDFKALV